MSDDTPVECHPEALAALIERQARELAQTGIVAMASFLHAVPKENRPAILEAVYGLTSALDSFHPALRPVLSVSAGGKLTCVLEGAPHLPPVVFDLYAQAVIPNAPTSATPQ